MPKSERHNFWCISTFQPTIDIFRVFKKVIIMHQLAITVFLKVDFLPSLRLGARGLRHHGSDLVNLHSASLEFIVKLTHFKQTIKGWIECRDSCRHIKLVTTCGGLHRTWTSFCTSCWWSSSRKRAWLVAEGIWVQRLMVPFKLFKLKALCFVCLVKWRK